MTNALDGVRDKELHFGRVVIAARKNIAGDIHQPIMARFLEQRRADFSTP